MKIKAFLASDYLTHWSLLLARLSLPFDRLIVALVALVACPFQFYSQLSISNTISSQ